MQFVPKQMVNALVSQGRGLSPAKLLPALVTVDDDQVSILNVCDTCMLNLLFVWAHLTYMIFLGSYLCYRRSISFKIKTYVKILYLNFIFEKSWVLFSVEEHAIPAEVFLNILKQMLE
jgi:hypothetical protein